MIIVPAILTNDPADFREQIIRLAPYYQHFSLDIIDGKLYPNTTLTLEETMQELYALPKDIRDHVVFDFDCMVQDTEAVYRYFTTHTPTINVGVIIFHAKADPQPHVFEHPEIRSGLALAPADTVETVFKTWHAHQVKAIQIMSVEPGFQGSPFQVDTLKKIEQLRTAGYGSNIFTDGSMNNETISLLQKLDYQPDYVCVGSYLSKAGNDLSHRVNVLEKIVA